jgi:hypothetical protein
MMMTVARTATNARDINEALWSASESVASGGTCTLTAEESVTLLIFFGTPSRNDLVETTYRDRRGFTPLELSSKSCGQFN